MLFCSLIMTCDFQLKNICKSKLDVTQNIKVVFEKVENYVGKGENAGFSPFPTMFSKRVLECVKSGNCVLKPQAFVL